MNFIKRHTHLFAGLGLTLLVIAWMGDAFAQDAVDVQQNIDIAEVDQRATEAKGKANSLELRVTSAEGELVTHGTEVSALATGQASLNTQVGNNDARISALEASPSANQAQVDSNSQRISALEAGTGGTAIPVWTIRDSQGLLVGAWQDRSAVGRGIVETPYGPVPFHVTPTSFHWELDDSDIRWTTSTCDMVPSKIGVPAAIANQMDSFNGEGSQGFIMNGDAYLVNWSLVDVAIVFRVWIEPVPGGPNPCQANPVNEPDSGQYYPLVLAAPNPLYLPPFTIGQEVLQ